MAEMRIRHMIAGLLNYQIVFNFDESGERILTIEDRRVTVRDVGFFGAFTAPLLAVIFNALHAKQHRNSRTRRHQVR